jgi:hypothetical protein
MTPEIGAIGPKYGFRQGAETKEAILKTQDLQASKPEIGQVAVARGNAGAAHEQTIDRSDQAAEYSAGRGERGGSSVRHHGHLLGLQPKAALRSGANLGIPDTSDNPLVCMAAIEILQRNINETIGFPNNEKAAENRRLFEIFGKPVYSAATFRGGSSAPEAWISAT